MLFKTCCQRFRVWTVAEIGAVRYPGGTELPLKSCDSQPSSPLLAIPGVGGSALFAVFNY